jgi:hypothetical protein
VAVKLNYHLCIINQRHNLHNATNVVTLLNLGTLGFVNAFLYVLVWWKSNKFVI